jgi:hypothetical protein
MPLKPTAPVGVAKPVPVLETVTVHALVTPIMPSLGHVKTVVVGPLPSLNCARKARSVAATLSQRFVLIRWKIRFPPA